MRENDLATPDEVADYLRVTERALTMMRSRKEGPVFIKVGTRVRYRWSDVLEYVEARTHGAV